jgi:hypothetical protein
MRSLLGISGAALALAVSSAAFANAHKEAPDMKAASGAASAPMTARQTKKGDCNRKATGKTGAERKAFIKTCLSS